MGYLILSYQSYKSIMMKWLVLYYSKYDRYTRCFQAFKSKEEAISYKDKVLFDYNVIGIVELKEPIYL